MSIESQPFDPDERRIEAMMDGSGFSRERAEIKLGQKVVSGATELSRSPRPPRKPHRTGHVRDFETLSSEQPVIIARGRAAVEAALDEAFGKDRKVQAIIDEVHRLIPIDRDNVAKSEADRERMITARLRTFFDSQK